MQPANVPKRRTKKVQHKPKPFSAPKAWPPKADETASSLYSLEGLFAAFQKAVADEDDGPVVGAWHGTMQEDLQHVHNVLCVACCVLMHEGQSLEDCGCFGLA